MSALLKTQPTKDSGTEHLLMWCAANLDTPKDVRNVLSVFGEDLSSSNIFSNPLFLANGHFAPSPKTVAYLANRKTKKFASKVIKRGGALLSAETGGVNTLAVGKGLNAGASTAMHLGQLKRFVNDATKESKTLSAWLDLAIDIKLRKGGRAAGSTISNLVPLITSIPGVSDAIDTITDMYCSAPEEAVIGRFAMEIHWRAYRELVIASALSGASGKQGVGPASNIFYEIFKRRGATRIFGSYDQSELIKEPAAWFALYDKLSL
jgi:hypothetical protein